MKVSKKISAVDSKDLNYFLQSKVQVLSTKAQSILERGDLEIGELYQDLFIEIGRGNLKQMIEGEQNDQLVAQILLKLMMMGYNQDVTLHQERIRARYQTSFWVDFINRFNDYGSEGYKLELLKKFEGIFVELVDNITHLLEINPDDTFEALNVTDPEDELFDDFFSNKRDLGKIIKELAKLIGVGTVNNILIPKLDAAIALA
jgi:hypothetical protein